MVEHITQDKYMETSKIRSKDQLLRPFRLVALILALVGIIGQSWSFAFMAVGFQLFAELGQRLSHDIIRLILGEEA